MARYATRRSPKKLLCDEFAGRIVKLKTDRGVICLNLCENSSEQSYCIGIEGGGRLHANIHCFSFCT